MLCPELPYSPKIPSLTLLTYQQGLSAVAECQEQLLLAPAQSSLSQ